MKLRTPTRKMSRSSSPQFFNRKKKVLMVALGLVLFSLLMGGRFIHKSNTDKITGHPTTEIKLNAGTPEEFVVPKDSTKISEVKYLNDPKYTGFVQSNQSLEVSQASWGSAVGYETTTLEMTTLLPRKTGKPVFLYSAYQTMHEDAFFSVNEETGEVDYLLGVESNEVITSNKFDDLAKSRRANATAQVFSDDSVSVMTINSDVDPRVNRFYKFDSDLKRVTSKDLKLPYTAYQTFIYHGNTATTPRVEVYPDTESLKNQDTTMTIQSIESDGNLLEPIVVESLSSYMESIIEFSGIQEGSVFFYEFTDLIELSDGGFIAQIFAGDYRNWEEKSLNLLVKYNKEGEIVYFPDLDKEVSLTTYDFFDKQNPDKLIGYKNNLEKSEIIQITNGEVDKTSVIKDLPSKTNIAIADKNKGVYAFAGVLNTIPNTGDFSSSSPGYISGFFDENFNLLSVKNVKGDVSNVTTDPQMLIRGSNIYTTGRIFDNQEFVSAPQNGWIASKPQQQFSYYKKFEAVDDYAPLIKAGSPLNLDTVEFNQYTQVEKDNFLIYGKKEGISTAGKAVQVIDTMDDEEYSNGWLGRRINRNPNTFNSEGESDEEIEWSALGLDVSRYGPNTVTYFVTDSQYLTTSTSKLVNILNENVSSTNTKALGADNFSISISDVSALTETQSKVNSNAMTWDLKTGAIDPNITVNADQLDEIRQSQTRYQAQKKAEGTDKFKGYTDILKPYPLDISYMYSESSKDKTLTHRVWVFVTQDNTAVMNGVVMYADNFTIPLKKAVDATAESLLTTPKFKQTEPNVRIYSFNSQPQKEKKMTPITTGKKNGTSKGLSVSADSVAEITQVTEAETVNNVELTYTDDEGQVTPVLVDVTIDGTTDFCFKIERTKDEASFYDLILDPTINENFKSVEVVLPKNYTFKADTTIPTGWETIPPKLETSTVHYQFNMKTKNQLSEIQAFLESLKLTITNPVDQESSVTINLYEAEQLPDGKVTKKQASSKTLSYSRIVETNDFWLAAENKWDSQERKNYVDLEWEQIPDLDQSGYQLYQRKEDSQEWEGRSLNFGKSISVLNVHPDPEVANVLKMWMEDIDMGHLIKVTPVKISEYNDNPDFYLKNAEGEYQYDVIMFGTIDRNADQDLTEEGYEGTRRFEESGRGILFGHDTLYYGNPNFMKFAPEVGVSFEDSTDGVYGKKVKVVNDGYLMKFPFEMKNEQILTIPVTHTVQFLDKTSNPTLWLEFSKPFMNTEGMGGEGIETPTKTDNWYLATKNNLAMIQTGHSNDGNLDSGSTIEERKIIANVLYNLAQVSVDNSAQDHTVKDEAAPEMTSITKDHTNNVILDAKDYGTDYQFYVTASTKDKGVLKSDVMKESVISDIQGYVYVLDDQPATLPDVSKDEYGRVDNLTIEINDPEESRKGVVTNITSANQWLHVVPVDRANNVGDVQHIKLDDVPYEETPTVIGCSAGVPQKINVQAYDTLGRRLSTEYDTIFDDQLRLEKNYTLDSQTLTTIEFYDFWKLTNKKDEDLTKTFTITNQLQEVKGIYQRTVQKLHIREVVLSPTSQVPKPFEGASQMITSDDNNAELSRSFTSYDSGTDEAMLYTDQLIGMDAFNPTHTIVPVIPEYYQYDGHVLTTTYGLHASEDREKGTITYDAALTPEIWVTIYIKPSTTSPGFYGWHRLLPDDEVYQVVP